VRYLVSIVACVVLGGIGSQAAQDPANPLEVLAEFVGPEWVATFPDGKLTDTQRFDWMFGGKFLRNPHQVKDAQGKVVYEGETIYGFDARQQVLRWWYFNATGGFIEGTVKIEDDGTLVFEGENHAAKSQIAKVRSSSRLAAPDHWLSTTWFWRDGRWDVERELEFRPR